MSLAHVVAVQSSTLDAADLTDLRIAQVASQAINRTTERFRATAAKMIRQQVAFPAAYLAPTGDRLIVDKHANAQDLSAYIRGRSRPTSLARFAMGGRVGARRGARVQVQPGLVRFLPKGFFINLRSGNTDTKGNLGLAIRLREGQVPHSAYKPKLIGRGLWLLYGPSIDQVFDDVADEVSPAAADFLSAEFLRLMRLQ